jgi:hypothetical protein
MEAGLHPSLGVGDAEPVVVPVRGCRVDFSPRVPVRVLVRTRAFPLVAEGRQQRSPSRCRLRLKTCLGPEMRLLWLEARVAPSYGALSPKDSGDPFLLLLGREAAVAEFGGISHHGPEHNMGCQASGLEGVPCFGSVSSVEVFSDRALRDVQSGSGGFSRARCLPPISVLMRARAGTRKRILLGGACLCLVTGFAWHGWANVLLPVAFALSLLGVGAELQRALPNRRLMLVVSGTAVMVGTAAIHHFLPRGSTLRLTTDGVLVMSTLVILVAIAPYLRTTAANQRA